MKVGLMGEGGGSREERDKFEMEDEGEGAKGKRDTKLDRVAGKVRRGKRAQR